MRPKQNGRRFADDTFKRIFLNENMWISINISPKFVPEGPIADQATSHYLKQWWLDYRRIYAGLGLSELNEIEISIYDIE